MTQLPEKQQQYLEKHSFFLFFFAGMIYSLLTTNFINYKKYNRKFLD